MLAEDGSDGNESPSRSSVPSPHPSVAPARIRLRAPVEHGQTLQRPPLEIADALWQRNLDLTSSQLCTIGGRSIQSIRADLQAAILQAARTYVVECGMADPLADRSERQIVMSGHQPSLFHPGVWFKNFVLSHLAEQFQCIGLNLVVDNDICESASIRVPRSVDEYATTVTVPFDQPAVAIPFEERALIDVETFASFGDRAASAIQPFVDDPIVRQLWPNTLATAKQFGQAGTQPRLGSVVAAGRHRLESNVGLKTLELPVSRVAETEPFSLFVAHVIQNIGLFQEIHNDCLLDYRELYRIRSHSHPVPKLAASSGWLETPFWIWQTNFPARRRLFVRLAPGTIALTDREHWRWETEIGSLPTGLQELAQTGVKIRPRALMTTMFCRLLACDLFIHGIGGAKYDQLTDLIAARFFGVRLPEFFTISATYRLPTGADLRLPEKLAAVRQQLREFEYHPEKLVESPDRDAQRLIRTKRQLVCTPVKKSDRRHRHQGIVECNRALRRYVQPQIDELQQQLRKLPAQIRASRIFGSREFSFCLFPESTVGNLHQSLNTIQPADRIV